MESFLVKHKKYDTSKLLATIIEDGKQYYIVQWSRLTLSTSFGVSGTFIDKLPVEECEVIREPGRFERKSIYLFKKIFHLKRFALLIKL